MSASLDNLAISLLDRVSPSGALAQVAIDHGNPELDAELDRFDGLERKAAEILAAPGAGGVRSIVARLEDDFALAVPTLAEAAVPLEAWAIPLLSALAGPAAPLVSVGLVLACKVALMALQHWASKRAGRQPE